MINIIIENGLNIELNKNESCAHVIYSPKAKGTVLIPKYVVFQSQKFEITKIKEGAFKNNHFIEILTFPEDSSLISIEKNAFKYSSIKSIFIPSICSELQEGWCNKTQELINVTISPNNHYFKYADEEHKIIIGKSDKKTEIFDVIIFGCRDLEKINIPSTIKVISSYSFEYCSQLRSIEILENSNIQIIGKKVFSFSLINKIFIPSKVEKIQEGFFSDILQLKNVVISPFNKCFKFADEQNQIILGKSDKKTDNYDIFLYANADIKEAKILSSIKRIGNYVFKYCLYLESIEIPENSELQSIGVEAIADTFNESIFIPKHVMELEDGWCKGILNLNKVIISPENQYYKYLDESKQIIVRKSDNNSDIYDVIVFACRSITNAIIPSYIKTINSHAFKYCSQLKTIVFSKNSQLKTIGKEAFANTKIESIIIPRNVETIGELAFNWCQKLQRVKIQKRSKLQSIPKSLFDGCYNLKSIKIPKQCEIISIKNKAFYASSIKNIYIPPSIKELEEEWLSGMNALHNVKISSDNHHFKYADEKRRIVVGKSNENSENYDILIFASRYSTYVNIPDNITRINSYAFNCCDLLKTIEISENSQLQSIGIESFNYCRELENFYIPSNLEELQDGWCSSTRNLINITISPNNKNFKYSDIDRKLIIGKSDTNKDEFDVIEFACRDIEAVKIPSTIKIIKSCSFEFCNKLKIVEVPDNSELRIIKESAFSQSSIESIRIPKNVEMIENNSFLACSNLKKFELAKGSKLKTFSQCLFDSCSSLKTIRIPEKSQIKKIEQFAFNYSAIENLYIPSSISILEDGWCDSTEKLTNIIISPKNENIQYLDNKHQIVVCKSDVNNDDFDIISFANRSIQNVKIPKSIKQISSSAFFNCKQLKTIEIQENSKLQSIGFYAFHSTSIQNIIIPKNVKEIGNGTFSCCYSLKSIEFQCEYLYDCSVLFTYSSQIEIISFPNIHNITIKEEDFSHIENASLFIRANSYEVLDSKNNATINFL